MEKLAGKKMSKIAGNAGFFRFPWCLFLEYAYMDFSGDNHERNTPKNNKNQARNPIWVYQINATGRAGGGWGGLWANLSLYQSRDCWRTGRDPATSPFLSLMSPSRRRGFARGPQRGDNPHSFQLRKAWEGGGKGGQRGRGGEQGFHLLVRKKTGQI